MVDKARLCRQLLSFMLLVRSWLRHQNISIGAVGGGRFVIVSDGASHYGFVTFPIRIHLNCRKALYFEGFDKSLVYFRRFQSGLRCAKRVQCKRFSRPINSASRKHATGSGELRSLSIVRFDHAISLCLSRIQYTN